MKSSIIKKNLVSGISEPQLRSKGEKNICNKNGTSLRYSMMLAHKAQERGLQSRIRKVKVIALVW
jgi:hypothetical protein